MDQHFFSKTVWGFILIGAGVLFLLNQTGAVDIDIGSLIADYWPVILIYFGLKGIVIHRKLEYGWGGSYIWNLLLVVLGGYFLLRNLHIMVFEGVDLWQFIVPVALILMGLRLLGRGPGDRRERRAAKREQYRLEREAFREQRLQAKMARKEQNFRDKLEQKFQSSHSGPQGDFPHSDGTEPPPVYDPNYARKMEYDLDQAFHERVVKKLGDDPFPLVSQLPPETNTGSVQNQEPSAKRDGNAATTANTYDPRFGHMPPPASPQKREHSWQTEERHQGYKGHVAERSNFIGDIHLGQDYWELEPTNVSHFIGDTIIDLTKAGIPYGETNITVSAFIGDVKVFVPNDIQVEVSVTASAFIGDMKVMDRHEGGLFRHIKHDTPHYQEAEKRIRLTVSMFIGDVFVKRVG